MWQREHIDWSSIEKELTPKLTCHRCGIAKYKECYAVAQWNKALKQGNCKKCVKQRQEEDNTPLDCTYCGEWKEAEAFPPHLRHNYAKYRPCLDCVETRMCIACRLHKQREAFSKGEWEHSRRNNA